MAERTTTLRPAIAPLRRDPKLAPVAEAFENAQVQLDAIGKRIKTAEESIGDVSASVSDVEDSFASSVDDVFLTGSPTVTKNADGTLTVSVAYAPPYIDPITRSIGEFAGVQPVYEGPTGAVEPQADQPYLSDPKADPPANLGTVSITRRFTGGETFYLHALAWARTGVRKTYQPHTLAPSQRWMEITVSTDDLTGYPADGNVTSLAATVLSSRVDESGKQWAKIRATYGIVPGLETYRAYAYLGAAPPEDVEDWGGPRGESTGTRIDFEVEVPEAGGTYQVAVTASARGVTTPVMGSTPITTVTLDPQGKAPQVTFFFVQVLNVERNGVPVVELAFNFTKPSSTNWAAVKFQIREGVAGGGYAVGSSWKDYGETVTTAVSRFWGLPTSAAQYFHFRALSITPAGKVNETDTPPTDFVTIGAGAGINLGAAKSLSYTSDFAIVGNQLTVNGVNFGLAYGFDSAIFEVSAGAFTIKELVADKIVAGTLGLGVGYAGRINVDQLDAGTATFSGTATFKSGTSGPYVEISSSGVRIAGGGTVVAVDSSGLRAPTIVATGQFWAQGGFQVVKWNGTGYDYLLYNGSIGGVAGILCARFQCAYFGGSSITVESPSGWRSALNVSEKTTVTGATVTLAKITPGGTDGSLTFDNEGRVTACTQPT